MANLINETPAYTFDDVIIIPNYNNIQSRKDVDLSQTFDIYLNDSYNKRVAKLPICSANMDTVTGAKMARAIIEAGGWAFLHRFQTIEENVKEWQEITSTHYKNSLFCSLGINEGLSRFEALYKVGARNFCVDVAHGHSEQVRKFLAQIRSYRDIVIVAGNVCTPEGVRFLEQSGADIIKVGIGGGSACTTRIKTGCGLPQLTAILECAETATLPIIADGGIRSPGDIVKALAAGASMVMLGGMLAGTDEAPGGLIVIGGQMYKNYRGNASREINEEKLGGLSEWKTAEGISTNVLYKGKVKDILHDIEGGLRSGMTYVGAENLFQLRSYASFRVVTLNGQKEALPHAKRD